MPENPDRAGQSSSAAQSSGAGEGDGAGKWSQAVMRAWLERHSPNWGTPPGETLDGLLRRARAWQNLKYREGLAGIAWPAEVGGQGRTAGEQLLWDLEAARFDVPEAVFIVSMAVAGPTINDHGSAEQKSACLRPILTGEAIWCQLFSEPDAGSDLAAVRTKATRAGDGWRVSGQKVWTSGAHYADHAILLARTSAESKHGGLSFFLVDMKAPGIHARPIKQINGEAHFNEVFLDDVPLPADSLLGGEGQGWPIARTALRHERLGLLARRRIDLTRFLDMVTGRLGPVPGPGQAERWARIARLALRARLVDLLAQRDFEAVLAGRDLGSSPSVGKLAAALLINDVADCATVVAGAGALAGPPGDGGISPWSLAFLEAPSRRLAGGTDEIQRSLIAEGALGLPRTRG